MIRKKPRIPHTKTTFTCCATKYFYKDIFYEILRDHDWSDLYKETNTESSWKILITFIIKTLDNMCPFKTFRNVPVRADWMTSELFERIAFRDQKFKTARHSKDNKNWEKAKKTKNELNFDCKQAKGDYIKNKLNENKLNPRKFWEVLTPLVNPQKVKIISELSLRDADTNEIIHKENTANSMNKFYFINIGEKLATLIEPPLNSELIPLENANNNTISIDPNLTFKFRPIEQEEVWNIVKEIQTHKSSGIKNASTYFLKLAFKALIPQVTHILNTSLSSGQIPDEWKIVKSHTTL